MRYWFSTQHVSKTVVSKSEYPENQLKRKLFIIISLSLSLSKAHQKLSRMSGQSHLDPHAAARGTHRRCGPETWHRHEPGRFPTRSRTGRRPRWWAGWGTISTAFKGQNYSYYEEKNKLGNVGIAIINHPSLMVYYTHLWWLGGWFIIAIPTLLIFAKPTEIFGPELVKMGKHKFAQSCFPII